MNQMLLLAALSGAMFSIGGACLPGSLSLTEVSNEYLGICLTKSNAHHILG